MTNLEDIGCSKIERLLGQEKHICKRYSHLLPWHQLLKHCTRRKFKVSFDWLQNELSNDVNKNVHCLQTLKQFKFLRIHAILHDAAGCLQEKNHTGPGYTYVLPCPIKNCYLGHVTGIAFCLFLKAFKA